MLDKLKAFGDSAKNFFLYVIGPFTVVFGGIFYLLGKNKDLKAQLARQESESKTNEVLKQVDEAGKTADALDKRYSDLKSEYDRSRRP